MPDMNKTALFVIAPEQFRDEEYAHPKEVLEAAGISTVTASDEAGICKGRFGLEAPATLSLHEAKMRDWDIVIFVGGGGANVFFDDEDAYELATKTVSDGKILGAICIAPIILARANLLGGLIVTSFPSEQGELVAAGTKWTGNPVEIAPIAGTGAYIITASGPEAAYAFGEAIRDKVFE